MSNISKNLGKIIFLGIIIALVACTRVTQANFEKIQAGMSMEQVIKILGEPNDSSSINIAGISGTSASWKNHSATLVVQFLDGKVMIKSFNKTGQNNQQQDLQMNLNPDNDQ